MEVFLAGVIVAVIVVAVSIVAILIANEGRAPRGATQDLIKRIEEWEVAQRRLALTCRQCNAMSPPIPETHNRYHCETCGHQFVAARHGQVERP